MESDIEHKSAPIKGRKDREIGLANRLAKTFEGHSVRSVGQQTGYHPETIRRYIQGASTTPADFVGRIVNEFGVSSHFILTGVCNTPNNEELRLVTTDRLINELGRRIHMIENSAVGSALINRSFFD